MQSKSILKVFLIFFTFYFIFLITIFLMRYPLIIILTLHLIMMVQKCMITLKSANTNSVVIEFILSTAYDISTATENQTKNIYVDGSFSKA